MVSSPHRTSPGLWVPKILTPCLKKRRRAKRAVPGKLKGKKVHGVALELSQFNQKVSKCQLQVVSLQNNRTSLLHL